MNMDTVLQSKEIANSPEYVYQCTPVLPVLFGLIFILLFFVSELIQSLCLAIMAHGQSKHLSHIVILYIVGICINVCLSFNIFMIKGDIVKWESFDSLRQVPANTVIFTQQGHHPKKR